MRRCPNTIPVVTKVAVLASFGLGLYYEPCDTTKELLQVFRNRERVIQCKYCSVLRQAFPIFTSPLGSRLLSHFAIDYPPFTIHRMP